jgi:transposase
MQVVYPRCCGLDVHKKTVVACVLLTDADGAVHRFVRTFGTMTADLVALGDWLQFHGVIHVAMESTGVLWRLVFNVLEEGCTLLLVNAQHVKACTTDSLQWKYGGLDRHGRGDRSDPCVVWPAIAVA